MSATEALKHEHRVIERMLVVLEAADAKVEAGGRVAKTVLFKGDRLYSQFR